MKEYWVTQRENHHRDKSKKKVKKLFIDEMKNTSYAVCIEHDWIKSTTIKYYSITHGTKSNRARDERAHEFSIFVRERNAERRNE